MKWLIEEQVTLTSENFVFDPPEGDHVDGWRYRGDFVYDGRKVDVYVYPMGEDVFGTKMFFRAKGKNVRIVGYMYPYSFLNDRTPDQMHQILITGTKVIE